LKRSPSSESQRRTSKKEMAAWAVGGAALAALPVGSAVLSNLDDSVSGQEVSAEAEGTIPKDDEDLAAAVIAYKGDLAAALPASA